jgi:hypothetical protein
MKNSKEGRVAEVIPKAKAASLPGSAKSKTGAARLSVDRSGIGMKALLGSKNWASRWSIAQRPGASECKSGPTATRCYRWAGHGLPLAQRRYAALHSIAMLRFHIFLDVLRGHRALEGSTVRQILLFFREDGPWTGRVPSAVHDVRMSIVTAMHAAVPTSVHGPVQKTELPTTPDHICLLTRRCLRRIQSSALA